MEEGRKECFDSVTWESALPNTNPSGPGFRQSNMDVNEDPHQPKWEGYLITSVKDPVKELAETKDAYVSYLVYAKTNLPIFSTPNPSSRRRFQDFVFLREHLVRDFPACVVPALPDKHRLEYITGDRFSPEFMERRRLDLHRFLQRLSRHPTLQRSTLLRAFLNRPNGLVTFIKALDVTYSHSSFNLACSYASTYCPSSPPRAISWLIDNISDTLLNAFARVRKPDERFLVMRENVDKFEEGLVLCERLYNRIRGRSSDGNPDSHEDLTADYHDLAVAVQGLGFLESGITDPLNHFSNTLLEFSALERHLKQLDFEELSDYLSGVTAERDRLAAVINGHAGSTGLGLGAYIRDRVDAIRGVDDDRSRVERMRKLDVKIKELQDAVTTAHETSDAFSDETLREQAVFQYAKEAEMKEMLGDLANGEIEFYKTAMEEWDRIIPVIQRIRVDV
ncbi:lipid binding protein [Cyathus striatus]|nr:lipid binding protein [Cyathus striatus]